MLFYIQVTILTLSDGFPTYERLPSVSKYLIITIEEAVVDKPVLTIVILGTLELFHKCSKNTGSAGSLKEKP